VAVGSFTPLSGTKLPGTSNVPVLQIKLTNPSGAALSITSIKLTASGTGIDNTGIISVTVYTDLNGDGTVDGGDTALGSATYASDNGTVLISFNNPLPAFATQNYLVVYNFSPTAPGGTYQASVVGSLDLTGGNTTTGQTISFTGVPVNGATITISTATTTPTFTPTVTTTRTATAIASGTPTPVIFPNPSDGTKPVCVNVPGLASNSNVTVQIFTIAFRKVQEIPFTNVPAGTVSFSLTDRYGTPLASGLYYVVITTTPSGATGQSPKRSVGKLLLLR
jgi:hypothetical protein